MRHFIVSKVNENKTTKGNNMISKQCNGIDRVWNVSNN